MPLRPKDAGRLPLGGSDSRPWAPNRSEVWPSGAWAQHGECRGGRSAAAVRGSRHRRRKARPPSVWDSHEPDREELREFLNAAIRDYARSFVAHQRR